VGGSLTVGEVNTIEGLAALERPWNDLAQKVDPVVLTTTFPFASVWWRHRSLDNRLFVLTVKDGTRLVGIAPLMISEVDWGMVRARKVSFMFARYLESDFIAEPELKEECIRATVQHAFKSTRCHYLELGGLAKTSSSIPSLKKVAEESGMGFSQGYHSSGRYIPVAGTWESFLKGRSAGFRKDLRYYERKLRGRGKLETVRMGGGDSEEILRRLRLVDHGSWKLEWFARPENVDWMNGLIVESGKRGWLDTFLLELDGAPIAYVVFIRPTGKAYAMFTGYDLRLAHESPGMVCFSKALNQIFDEGGVSEVDFLSNYPYLHSWTDKARSRYLVTLYPEGTSGIVVRMGRRFLHRARSIP
jgi:CelD/BcsL family acetyltransferase involved in cellulose biosynthesis